MAVTNMGIYHSWKILAENRTVWRKIIYNEHINQVNMAQVEAANREVLICDMCNRTCLSRIALNSNMRTHV